MAPLSVLIFSQLMMIAVIHVCRYNNGKLKKKWMRNKIKAKSILHMGCPSTMAAVFSCIPWAYYEVIFEYC